MEFGLDQDAIMCNQMTRFFIRVWIQLVFIGGELVFVFRLVRVVRMGDLVVESHQRAC